VLLSLSRGDLLGSRLFVAFVSEPLEALALELCELDLVVHLPLPDQAPPALAIDDGRTVRLTA
jgi:hypothetical protein